MKPLQIVMITLFLCVVNIGLAQEVQHNKQTFYVSGNFVFNAGENVTETLSLDDKKAIFSKLKANEKAKEKAIAKAEKKARAAEKKLKQSEKALKKEQKLIRAKEKAQSQLKRVQSDLEKEQKKFDRLKRKDKLTPESTFKFEQRILKLNEKIRRAQLKLKAI